MVIAHYPDQKCDHVPFRLPANQPFIVLLSFGYMFGLFKLRFCKKWQYFDLKLFSWKLGGGWGEKVTCGIVLGLLNEPIIVDFSIIDHYVSKPRYS